MACCLREIDRDPWSASEMLKPKIVSKKKLDNNNETK